MATTTLTKRPARRLSFLPLSARPFEDFDTRLRRMFEGMLPDDGAEAIGMVPAVEIAETPESYVCTAELPGMKEAEITIDFENGMLMIKGEKRDERETGGRDKRYHVWERSYGAFERSFTFPGRVDEGKIAAEMKDGVLTITLPKAEEEKAKSRRIEIAKK